MLEKKEKYWDMNEKSKAKVSLSSTPRYEVIAPSPTALNAYQNKGS
jgi:hypothetical protein